MRGKSVVVKVRIPKNWYDALQKMVKEGRSTTVAGAVRDGVWLLLQLRASEENKVSCCVEFIGRRIELTRM